MNPLSLKFTVITGGVLAALLIASALTVYIQSIRLDLKDEKITTLTKERAAALSDLSTCQQTAEDAYAISNQYQKENTALRDRASQLKRLLNDLPDQCIPIQATAGRPDAATPGALSGSRGILAGPLIETGAECDEIVNQLTALQDFIEAGKPLKPAR